MSDFDFGDAVKRTIAEQHDEIAALRTENDQLVMKLDTAHIVRQNVERENAKLRELVRDMWHEGMCECGSRGKCASCEYDYPTRMRELGIEVGA